MSGSVVGFPLYYNPGAIRELEKLHELVDIRAASSCLGEILSFNLLARDVSKTSRLRLLYSRRRGASKSDIPY